MKLLLVMAFSSFFSVAQAGYVPEPLTALYTWQPISQESIAINKTIENIFTDKITAEAHQSMHFDLLLHVTYYLCAKEKIIYNSTDLHKFVTELHTHHPFNKLSLAAVAGNVARRVSDTTIGCGTREVREAAYIFLKKYDFYVKTEMPVIGAGSNDGENPYKLFDRAELAEKNLKDFDLSISTTTTQDIWRGRKVYQYADNYINISKQGKVLHTISIPSFEDYQFPQISHTGITEAVKSVQLYKHLKKLILVVYNTENIVSIWTTDIEVLNKWTLAGVARPALSLDFKLDEAVDGFRNDSLSGFWQTTSKLAIDRQGQVYIVSSCPDGEYRSGSWKVHRIGNL